MGAIRLISSFIILSLDSTGAALHDSHVQTWGHGAAPEFINYMGGKCYFFCNCQLSE